MSDEPEFCLPDGQRIPGSHALVIIGPNGAGKTRLGVKLASQSNGSRIAALRNLQLPEALSYQSVKQTETQLESTLNQQRGKPWVQANEIVQVLNKLYAEHAEAAIKFCDRARASGSPGPVPDTKMTRLLDLWHRNFPNREIDFAGSPKINASHGKTPASYALAQMSDGERVAVYLAARVLDASAGVIVVDEPEVHFQTVLARKFWNDLEAARPDLRFAYITHDLPFAISRHGAQFLIADPKGNHKLLPLEASLPDAVIDGLLGAASFSVHARRFVFCEGARRNSRDEPFYEAWFAGPDTAVIPVGSCKRVIQCVEVLKTLDAIKGAEAVGIIDRDYWPDHHLDDLKRRGLHVLSVHEVEGLLCLKGVFAAVARYQPAVPDAEIDSRYAEFLRKAKGAFNSLDLNKQILERTKRRIELEIVRVLNQVHPDRDRLSVNSGVQAALQSGNWSFAPATVFAEEEAVVDAAAGGGADAFLRVLPGKSVFALAAGELGLVPDAYLKTIASALADTRKADAMPDGLYQLRSELETALKDHLPPRFLS